MGRQDLLILLAVGKNLETSGNIAAILFHSQEKGHTQESRQTSTNEVSIKRFWWKSLPFKLTFCKRTDVFRFLGYLTLSFFLARKMIVPPNRTGEIITSIAMYASF